MSGTLASDGWGDTSEYVAGDASGDVCVAVPCGGGAESAVAQVTSITLGPTPGVGDSVLPGRCTVITPPIVRCSDDSPAVTDWVDGAICVVGFDASEEFPMPANAQSMMAAIRPFLNSALNNHIQLSALNGSCAESKKTCRTRQPPNHGKFGP